MKHSLVLILLVCGLGAGGVAVARWATRPTLPPPPEVPADWADPPLVDFAHDARHAVVERPRDPAAWGGYGMVFQAHARDAEADECYRAAALLDPDDGRWPYLRAAISRAADPAAAVGLVRAALARKLPDGGHVLTAKLALADLLAETGQPAEAEAVCREVLAEHPNQPRATYRLAALLADRGDEAARPLLMGLARNPSAQQHAAGLLAGLFRRAGRTAEADGFEYAASLLPPDRPWPDAFTDPLGSLLRGQRALMDAIAAAERENRFADAADLSRKLADQYPGPAALLLLGRSLVSAGRPEEGRAVLAEAVRGDPGLVMAHAFTGIAEFQLGQRAESTLGKPAADGHYRRAAEALQKATELKPDYAVGYLYRGRALAALGQTAEAETAVRQFIDRRPEEWEGHAGLAELLRQTGRRDEAVKAAERAVALARKEELRPRQLLDQLRRGK